MTLLTKTRLLAKNHPSITKLSAESGLSREWIYLFIRDESRDYGVKKVQRLYEALIKDDAA